MTTPTSPASILVVDDEPSIRSFLTKVLNRCGYTPIAAADAGEALKILDRDNIDLVLLDLHMPGPADGEDLLYLLRDRGDDIPIIIVSGWVEDDSTRNHPDCVHAVLKKPVKIDVLTTTVAQVLGHT